MACRPCVIYCDFPLICCEKFFSERCFQRCARSAHFWDMKLARDDHAAKQSPELCQPNAPLHAARPRTGQTPLDSPPAHHSVTRTTLHSLFASQQLIIAVQIHREQARQAVQTSRSDLPGKATPTISDANHRRDKLLLLTRAKIVTLLHFC